MEVTTPELNVGEACDWAMPMESASSSVVQRLERVRGEASARWQANVVLMRMSWAAAASSETEDACALRASTMADHWRTSARCPRHT